ncbi:cortical protein marker for cell polarity-domain-containing protein [Cokeromyces recurvatus]|uniref:cortical protein marker for cell polarity-domain-containing protein n=1 Tax=Cokeromyces recurvatus TaxID=90255 RepID=UPI0022200A9C|nr:cortical protein marker for cell polarity-domain-containing protein [Cokeromyces recurvatus]KAI7906872.1 cortical protein marker for cell polarity-domain-containing protein [Cokeromyces recurvatus]
MVTILWFLIFILLFQQQSALELPAVQLDSVGGQLGFVGDYAGLSPFKNSLQFESLPTTSLITSDEEDDMLIFNFFSTINGSIETFCKLTDTQFILAGNFNTINHTTFNNIVQFDTQSRTFSPLQQGLDGPVYSVYCLNQSTVYVGGNFIAPINNSQQFTGHVAIWNDNQWSPVPWNGFNGPVYSILPHQQQQSILFAGQFDSTGDGQYMNQTFSQQINLISTATISEGNGMNFGNYSDPRNVLCSRAPWLLQDGVPGYWEATFNTPLEPSLFRLSNAHIDGKNTHSFSIISLGSNEYFELSYKDPVTNQNLTCTEECYLSNDLNIPYQDFTVLKPITTSGIRININTWYGSGGGLSGVSIFRTDVTLQPELSTESGNTESNCYSYLNSQSSVVSTTGHWSNQYSFGIYRNFLVASIPVSELSTTDVSATYQPYIYAQGIYNVYATTPGCIGTSSCDERTQAELTIQLTPGNKSTLILNQDIVNDENKLIYTGPIAATTNLFKPTIVMKVAPSARTSSTTNVTLFGSSIQFVRNSTSSTLSSILNYYPNNNTWLALPQQLPSGSIVHTLQANENKLYIGGQFTLNNNTINSLVAYDFDTGFVPLTDGGLNGDVSTSLLIDSNLIVGGSFNNTWIPQQRNDLNHVAIYNIQSNTWSGMDQGVNNNVDYLYSTDNKHIHLSGPFNASLNNNNAILYNNVEWDLNSQNWVTPTSLIVGPIANQVRIGPKTTLYLGSVKNAQTYRTTDFISLASSQSDSFSTSITQLDPDAIVNAGAFWKNKTETCLILAGHFHLNNTVYNLVMRTAGGTWQGVLQGIQGEIRTLSVIKNSLVAGGEFNGTAPDGTTMLTSILFYDLESQTIEGLNGLFDENGQPGQVNVIRPQGDGRTVFVGGHFTTAGLLGCSAICMLTMDTRQWNQIQPVISGTIHDMLLNDSGVLTVVGDLTIGTQQSISLAELDTTSTTATWKAAPYNEQFLSPVALIYDRDGSYLITGKTNNKSSNSSSYIANWNGENFTSIEHDLGPTTSIRQLLWAPIERSSAPTLSRYPANSDTMLMVVGHLDIPDFGDGSSSSSSVALYDGHRWYPYLLTASRDGATGGSISRVFTAVPCCTAIHSTRHYLSVPAVILISIAISLGIIFFLVLIAFLFLFIKRRHHPEYYHYSEPMKGWKPKYRPSSLLAMINAANLTDPSTTSTTTNTAAAATATATTAAADTFPAMNEKYSNNNPNTTTMVATGYSTAVDGGGHHAAIHRGQPTGVDLADMAVVGSSSSSVHKQPRMSSGGMSTGPLPFSIMMSNALHNSNNTNSPATEDSPQLYYAKYPFDAKEFGELAFGANTPIVVTDTSDNVWWMGYKDNGKGDAISGLFPSNYVTKSKPVI